MTPDPPSTQQGLLTHAEESNQEVPSAPASALTAVSAAPVRVAETPADPSAGVASVGEPAGMTAMQLSGDFSCELSALGGRMTDNCTAGWLGSQRLMSSSPVAFAVPAVSLAAAVTAVAPARGTHGSPAVGNSTPGSPAPGPAPGGSSGSATGGVAGFGISPLLTLAGLLLMGAPRAMRRLRLLCRPWRTACFVLIPERPG